MAAEIIPLDLSRFFEHHPTLETERLLLRPHAMADADDLFEAFRDPETVRYGPHEPARTIRDAEAMIEIVAKNFELQKTIRFGFELKSEHKTIGWCDLHHIAPEHHRLELGYSLSPRYCGKGYMTEAVREIICFALEDMGFHRIEASCDPRNVKSIRVAERCGMMHEATFRENEICKGEWVSNAIYAILRG